MKSRKDARDVCAGSGAEGPVDKLGADCFTPEVGKHVKVRTRARARMRTEPFIPSASASGLASNSRSSSGSGSCDSPDEWVLGEVAGRCMDGRWSVRICDEEPHSRDRTVGMGSGVRIRNLTTRPRYISGKARPATETGTNACLEHLRAKDLHKVVDVFGCVNVMSGSTGPACCEC